MANYCMTCGKKIGFFASYGEDIFTGNTANCICNECVASIDVILKKSEMKIPFKTEDFERFSEQGKKYIEEYLSADTEFEQAEEIDPMDCEVGDAVISHKFEVDEDECNAILQQLSKMDNTQIEEYLDPLVSENDTAESFMREIMELSDSEIASVIADQREYYNNAEWAFILYVDNFRKNIQAEINSAKNSEAPPQEVPDTYDSKEVERMKQVFSDNTNEELQEIINDGTYTYEARKAAQELLNN